MENQTDEKLVQATLDGDRRAFDVLVTRHYRKAVAVAGRLLGNIDDALEVAQDGFAKAYQALDQLKQPGQFGSWAMRIVVNYALNYRRDRSRRHMLTLATSETGDEDGGQMGVQVAGNEPSALENLQHRELEAALQEAIAELPEHLRAPLLLFAVEKLPQKEVAEMLNSTVPKVKWSVFEARRRLRKRLGRLLPAE